MRAELLKGNLNGMLLAVLSSGELHGYAIIETLRERSEGHVNLPSGTVYPALHRLEAAGLVSSDWQSHGGRKKRVYAITPAGERALSDNQRTWREVARTMSAVLFGGAADTNNRT
ncbi:PadR family transcriptional regulator [Kibdelosporangium phytohabitans]|uniref:PadR family transcriptional regulator n=1 Tax=Kibdelosporangium phytohabitans TaxID=860235 RepID=A0A0N9I1N6_9PSEU|nr:PadR family transcriptional regulator [Kibdelosporangium phytohabitans]ALG08590.1 PadR family transcriptional regulator [Kibdelosporangium phytohabitans]MBE1470328.1 DNA-binding PadR family transcriptional regulator [Kibdelosporangium phytohabitans]